MFIEFDAFILFFFPEHQNIERKHRTEVFVMLVTEELPEWEDSISIGEFDLIKIRFRLANIFSDS